MDLNKTLTHLKTYWQEADISEHSWFVGRILNEMPNFKVYCVKPKSKNIYLYVSHGISDSFNSEFFFISPQKSEKLIENLAMLASFSLKYPKEFQIGNVIDIGQPWIKNSSMELILISLPYPYGQSFEYDGNGVRYLWLLPIHQNEYDFLLKNGADALENLFNINEINYLDINRKSVINE